LTNLQIATNRSKRFVALLKIKLIANFEQRDERREAVCPRNWGAKHYTLHIQQFNNLLHLNLSLLGNKGVVRDYN